MISFDDVIMNRYYGPPLYGGITFSQRRVICKLCNWLFLKVFSAPYLTFASCVLTRFGKLFQNTDALDNWHIRL